MSNTALAFVRRVGFAIEIKDDTQLGLAILAAVYAAEARRAAGPALLVADGAWQAHYAQRPE